MTAAATDPEDLFDRAKAVPIADVCGQTLYRSGSRLRGPCPLCEAGVKSGRKSDGPFCVDPHANRFRCFACGEGGDVVTFIVLARKETPRDAARWLVGGGFPAPTPKVASMTPAVTPRQPSLIAQDLWRQRHDAPGTLVETYLRARGISGPVLTEALRRLGFHPNCYWGTEDGVHLRGPAMIARPQTHRGPLESVHVTYLAPHGHAKTARRPAKRMFGPQSDAEGAPGGVWLIGPPDPITYAAAAPTPVIVGEGIESTLSAAMLYRAPARAVATLSLDHLQGGLVRDAYGRVDLDCPAGDPRHPPFTWPNVMQAIIAVDRDMRAVSHRVRRPLIGGTMERRLDADGRARLCASLAEQGWRRAGTPRVSSMAPSPGRDFNDELLSGV